jgi:hypothetical protein
MRLHLHRTLWRKRPSRTPQHEILDVVPGPARVEREAPVELLLTDHTLADPAWGSHRAISSRTVR